MASTLSTPHFNGFKRHFPASPVALICQLLVPRPLLICLFNISSFKTNAGFQTLSLKFPQQFRMRSLIVSCTWYQSRLVLTRLWGTVTCIGKVKPENNQVCLCSYSDQLRDNSDVFQAPWNCSNATFLNKAINIGI